MGTADATVPMSNEWAVWLRDLRRRSLTGEARVNWSRAIEPNCIHGSGRHPASACLICRDSLELAEWRAYWRSLGAPVEVPFAAPSPVEPKGATE